MSNIAALLNDSPDNRASAPPQSFGHGAQGVVQIDQHPHLPCRPRLDLVPLKEPDAQRNSSQQLPSLQVGELSVPPHSSSSGVTPVVESQANPLWYSSAPSSHAKSTYAIPAGAEPFDARHGHASGLVVYSTPQEDSSSTATSPLSISGQELTIPVAIDYTIGSIREEKNRYKNRAASRRFRARRKNNIQKLERERDFFRRECDFYIEYIKFKLGSHMLPSRPPIPGR